MAAQTSIQWYESSKSLEPERADSPDLLSDEVRAALDDGAAMPATRYADAQRDAATLGPPLAELLGRYDGMLTPSASGVPPVGLYFTGDPLFCRVETLIGAPSISLPLAWTADGLPAGLQLIGAPRATRAPTRRSARPFGRMGSAIGLTVFAALHFEAVAAPRTTRWAGVAMIAAYFVGGLGCTLTVAASQRRGVDGLRRRLSGARTVVPSSVPHWRSSGPWSPSRQRPSLAAGMVASPGAGSWQGRAVSTVLGEVGGSRPMPPDVNPDIDQLCSFLADELEPAVVGAVAESGVEQPFVVELGWHDATLPPTLRIGGRRFRELMRTRYPQDEAAIARLRDAEPPDGAEIQVADRLSREALAVCAQVNAAQSRAIFEDVPTPTWESRVCGRLARELARRLNGRDWVGVSEPFLVLVRFGEHFEILEPFELAEQAAGAERVAAFRRSIASAVAPLGATRHDRGALAQLITARGLGRHADHLAHALAQPGLRLKPSSGPERSRFGGPPLLPPGGSWPRASAGPPLTFLAGIDLTELPEHDGMPEHGWFLFFSETENDAVAERLSEGPQQTALGASARAMYVPPGIEPIQARPPEDLVDELRSQPVIAVAQLTLADDYEVTDRLGLTAIEEQVYDEIVEQLRYDEKGYRAGTSDHWIAGLFTDVQRAPADPATALLLHMSDDESLDFVLLDGGSIQFRIPIAALAARDWSAITVETSSH